MEGDPNWGRVLDVLYEQEGKLYFIPKEGVAPGHPLVKETGLDSDDVNPAIRRLRSVGLVELTEHRMRDDTEDIDQRGDFIMLSQRGFEVAHDRDKANRQQQINKSLVLFTFALVVVGVIDIIPSGAAFGIGTFQIPGLFVQLSTAILLLLGILYIVQTQDIWQ